MTRDHDTKTSQADPERRGRYRKVEVRTWGDERFRMLSPMPPCGQGLWLYLITGPRTGPIPGLFSAGRAAMAEDLGWSTEAFGEAFREVFEQGMVQADFNARVVFIPRAIRHNRPESPNVVRNWGVEFDLIPECDLKREAFDTLRASIHALGESFGKAFDEAFRKPSPKPSGKPSPKAMPNQEQEQEQEQEQKSKDLSDANASSSTAAPSTSPSKRKPAKKTAPKDAAKDEAKEASQLPCPYRKIYDLYHAKLPGLPRVALMDSESRHKAMRKVWGWVLSTKKPGGERRAETAEQALAWLGDYFERASQNDFLMGRLSGGREGKHAEWRATFDFLLTERGMKHVIENTEVREVTA